MMYTELYEGSTYACIWASVTSQFQLFCVCVVCMQCAHARSIMCAGVRAHEWGCVHRSETDIRSLSQVLFTLFSEVVALAKPGAHSFG